MVLGLLLGIMGAWTIAEGVHVVRGGMSSGESNKFDAKNGSRGINPKEVVKIAQRNGVYPNKHGVLPEKPNSRIMSYVRQYANSPEDVRAFEREWYLTVKNQLDKKHERIRTESREATAYDKNEDYYRKFVIPYLSDETTFLKISHWHFMPEDLHRERMEAIKNHTILGQFIVNSSLRINPRIANSHEEFYELKLPKAKNMSSSQYRELYKNCCAHLGFDHMM